MTELKSGKIEDLLRNTPIRYNPEIQALSYAVLMEKQRILAEEATTRLSAMIDDLPDRILDVLAVELRTPAYRQSFPLRVKRELIRGTLGFYAHMGTPWAISWATSAIFGNGHITEWFDYGGKPHHFRVTVINDGTFSSLDGIGEFTELISSVKRLSSWMDDIAISTGMQAIALHAGGVMGSMLTIPIPEAG